MPAADAGPGRHPAPPSLTGEVDPDGLIWKEGAFRRDPWRPSPTGGEPGAAPLLLDKPRWLAERETLLSRSAPVGLCLVGGERVDDIADDLTRFALITLGFAKFSDGRAFSTARLLREKFGYGGELRAVGNVLSDQIPFMRRVGFDAFEVNHAPTRCALREGRIAEVRLYYQPVGPAPGPGTRTWLRGSLG
jgi:phosphoadenosine phosphosulfate reductase